MWVAESRSVRSNKASIYYEAYGSGPCVVFIPGGYETHLAFFKNVPAFVNAGYKVVTTNLRGHFQSPAAPGDLGFVHHAGDIEAVLDAEGVDRAALVGWSMGGFGATRLAATRPSRVAGLILMGSTAGVYSERNYAANKAAVDTALGWVGAGGPWPFHMGHADPEDAFLRRQLQMLHSDDGFLPGPVALLPMMMDRAAWLEPADLEEFAAPTLFVGGDADDFLPAGFQRHTVTLLPGAELSTFQDAGHQPHWEQPARFNAEVIGWLRSKGWG